MVSYADSLDCVGVLGSSVDTVRQVFGEFAGSHLSDHSPSDVISQEDSRDMTCASSSSRIAAKASTTKRLAALASNRPLSGLRIGLPIQTHLPEPYLHTSRHLLRHLQSLGASLVPVDLPSYRLALPAYYVLACAEASSNLARYGGGWYGSEPERQARDESGEERRRRIRTEGFGKEVKKRLLAGTYALSAKCVKYPGALRSKAYNQRVQQHISEGAVSPQSAPARIHHHLPYTASRPAITERTCGRSRPDLAPHGDTHCTSARCPGGGSQRKERIFAGHVDRTRELGRCTLHEHSSRPSGRWLACGRELDGPMGHGGTPVLRRSRYRGVDAWTQGVSVAFDQWHRALAISLQMAASRNKWRPTHGERIVKLVGLPTSASALLQSTVMGQGQT